MSIVLTLSVFPRIPSPVHPNEGDAWHLRSRVMDNLRGKNEGAYCPYLGCRKTPYCSGIKLYSPPFLFYLCIAVGIQDSNFLYLCDFGTKYFDIAHPWGVRKMQA